MLLKTMIRASRKLTWHLIKEQLVEANDIKVEQEDVLEDG